MAKKNVKPRGLGRGLDALFADDESISFDALTEDLREVGVGELHPGRFQPRRTIEDEQLAELAGSIREQGLISPIIVRPDNRDGGFEIIAGERRWRAVRKLGWDKVTVIVKDFDDKKTLAVALIENLQREDLNPIEEALGIERLIHEFEYTHEEAARALGRSRTATTNALRLLELTDEVKAMVERGELSMGHARALLGGKGARQVELAKEVLLKGLSVRQTEELVRRAVEGEPAKKQVVIKTRDDLKLEESLADTLGAVVKLKANKKGRGRIVIEFANLEQLQGIVEHIQR